MSFLKNKIIKTVLILLVLICIITAGAYVGNNPVQRALYTVVSPIYNAAYNVTTPVRQFCMHVKKADSYEKEINTLKEQLNTLKIENKTRSDYIAENKRLKELLDLRDNMKNYNTVTARVVSYEPNSWYDTVMLNKGKSEGVYAGDIVITNLGVVGKVISAGNNWAKVSTIINVANSVGTKLARTGDVGVVSGDATLAEGKLARLEYVSNDKNLIKGDILLTSGLGGVYPPDLMIGKVTEIVSDSAGNLEYGVVEPSIDFSSLYEVLVITYHDEADEGVN